jgi:hypothetical protein
MALASPRVYAPGSPTIPLWLLNGLNASRAEYSVRLAPEFAPLDFLSNAATCPKCGSHVGLCP